jgi:DNA polymerase elongation subunit (family B)
VMRIVNAYLAGRDLVVLQREGGALRRTVVAPEYVCYLRGVDVDADLRRKLASLPVIRSLRDEGEWLRVGWADEWARREWCFGKRGGQPSPFKMRGLETYEGDIHPVRRWMTDATVEVERPRRVFLDLETDSRVPFSRKEEARILSWGVKDAGGNERHGVLGDFTDRAERELLLGLWDALGDYDQVLAWNGDNFDEVVLRSRVQEVGCRVELDRLLWLDQLKLFKKMNHAESGDEKQSMKLDRVGKELLGEGKDDFDASKTWEAWSAGGDERERMVQYMRKDVDLQRRIEEKTGFAKLFDTIAELCGVFPDSRGLQSTVQMDGYMLRLGMERGVHFPTKHRLGEVEKFSGAHVMRPSARGIERDIHVCDFASLYPSIILTWNMSPETKVNGMRDGPIPPGCCRAPMTGQLFSTEVEGLLPSALRGILALRKEWNDKKSQCVPGTPEWHEADLWSTAYKVFANAFYGVLGTIYSRFYDKAIAESVSTTGVWFIKRVKLEAEARGITTIYADTDSAFAKGVSRTAFEEFVRWCNSDLCVAMVGEQGCKTNAIKLAYEKQFRRLVLVTAKKYAAQYAHYKGKEATADSKPEVRGLEYRRGDAALLARRLQEKAIRKIVVDGDERLETYREIVGEALRHVLHDQLPLAEVATAKSVQRPLGEYAQKKKIDGTPADQPPHVRVARVLEARGEEVVEGTKMEYVVLDGDGGINLVIPASDYEGELDRYYLWESLVYPPTQRLLQAAFPDADWVDGFERVRPPKPRSRGCVAAEGQTGLAFMPDEKVVVVPVEEWLGVDLEAIRGVLGAHPGQCPVEFRVRLRTGGEAVVAVPMRVSGSEAMARAVEAVLWGSAELSYWRRACAN